jgi:two-component system response regulator MprA
MEAPRVLVVEDDVALRRALERGLSEQGLRVAGAGDGASALAALQQSPDVQVVVLDIGLPDSDGRDVCQAMRAQGIDVPVLFLTARGQVDDLVSGYAVGADDYLAKPFHFAELVARVTALARRARRPSAEGHAATAEVHLDPARHTLRVADDEVRLTPTEYRILAALLGSPGRVVRRAELRVAAWPPGAVVHDNTLDQYVARIRRKLADAPGAPSLETVHGVGYTLG